MKALVGAFYQEKALVGAFSVIVKTGCGMEPMDRFTALVLAVAGAGPGSAAPLLSLP